MIEPIQFSPRLVLVPQGKMYDPLASWAAVREMEMMRNLELQASLAELRSLQSMERRNRFVMNMVDRWPIAVGLILAAFAPALQAMLVASAPWAMNFVFPFVVLAGRHELHLTGFLAHYLPLVVLYAQFPVEAMIAKKVLKRHIKISGVAMQIFFYHFLGIVQIMLITGTLRQFFVR